MIDIVRIAGPTRGDTRGIIRKPIPEGYEGAVTALWKIGRAYGLARNTVRCYANKLRVPLYTRKKDGDCLARLERVVLEEDLGRFLEWLSAEPGRAKRARMIAEARTM